MDKFCQRQKDLLHLEREAEISTSAENAQNLSAKRLTDCGIGIVKLRLDDVRSGFFGRKIIRFKRRNGQDLPAHRITSGDILGLYSSDKQISTGVVSTVTQNHIEVSFDEEGLEAEHEQEDFKLVKLANDVTYRRLKSSLDRLRDGSDSTNLKNILFNDGSLSPQHQNLPPKLQTHDDGRLKLFNENLDESQRDAVEFALKQKELAVIHGPPGTGKTTTIIEFIKQCVKSGLKLLCCAPSNVAVDNLLEKLTKYRVLRLGHPVRVSKENLQMLSLDAKLANCEQSGIIRDVRNDISALIAKRKFGSEIKQLRKELRERENSALKELLKNSDVILSTLTSASSDGPLKHLPKDHFDVVVIDECSQSLELSCWIVLPFAKKVVLAGDHQQLPPTIISDEAAKKGLSLTLMERILKMSHLKDDQSQVMRMLKVQYRMNEKIMKWSSKEFYSDQLSAHSSVKSHLLSDILGGDLCPDLRTPALLIDTTGCDMYEMETEDEISKANEGEVILACLHAEKLIAGGLKASDIAVVTPYNLQAELIRLQLKGKYPDLEIRSVDGFQGREKEAVILSLVRSNEKSQVGFLAEARRLNVAVTRARRHLAVICNAETVKSDDVLKGFVEYLEEECEVRSAMQFMDRIDDFEMIRPEGMELIVKDERIIINENEKKGAVGKKEKKSAAKKSEKSAAKGPNLNNTESSKARPQKESISNRNDEENDDDAKRSHFQNVIESFVASNDISYSFKPSLNSHDRLVIHEIAEQFDLIHESVGEGTKRHLIMRKKGSPKEETVAVNDQDHESKCKVCDKSVPAQNMALHELRCQATPQLQHEKVVLPSSSSSQSVKSQKKKNKKKKDAQENEDDIDKLLQQFDKIDNVCNGVKCKAKISVLGVSCEHCRKRFCLSHGIPEAHGCGEAARKEARKQIAREGKIYSGSGRPDHHLDAVKKKQLQKKLDKKLTELGEERKTKKKQK